MILYVYYSAQYTTSHKEHVIKYNLFGFVSFNDILILFFYSINYSK